MIKSSTLVAIAAGGTGGHIFPAECLAKELADRGHRLSWITDERGAKQSSFLTGIDTHIISARGLRGSGALRRLTGALSLGVGVFQARRILKSMRPHAVVGFGGYAAAPTMMAATNLKLATVIHEQNAVIGRANRVIARRVHRVCTTFSTTRLIPSDISHVQTGLPVREAFTAVRELPYAAPELDGEIRIFVLGGSQGAAIFSHLVPAALKRLPEDLRERIVVNQQCRREMVDQTRLAFADCNIKATLKPFFDNIPELIERTHLVISRAGASTVCEIAMAGRPALLVPYPHAADDHQTDNAKAIQGMGGAWCELQHDLTPTILAERLKTILTSPNTLVATARKAKAISIPDSAIRLADIVEDLNHSESSYSVTTRGAA
ncbi:MAG: undecaprenyldiphospho-muramoylpentapeptide beta-N-acetylglucosaminyltransferase [Rhodospirillaceae bacterium]